MLAFYDNIILENVRGNNMEKEKKFLYKICKNIYSPIIKMLYRPKVFGAENIPKEGRLIIAGNHKNALDPTIVMSNTNRIVHFMAKEELFKGIHGIIFKKIGLIKIHRKRSNPLAIIQAEDILNKEGTIGIFPEGTRNKTKQELLKFRTGTVLLAQKTNTKILPFAIRGDYKIFKNDLEIEFGKPIDVIGKQKEEANEYLRNEVLKLLEKKVGKNEIYIYNKSHSR